MQETLYVVYLQSWFDRKKPETKKYLTFDKKPNQDFEKIWRRNGVWTDVMSEATFISSKEKAEQIAWYYGVAFEEIK